MKKFFRNLFAGKKSTAPARRTAFRPKIEALEERAVMSVSYVDYMPASPPNYGDDALNSIYGANNDAWIVECTDNADTLTIHHNGAGSFTVTDETGQTFSSPAGVSIEHFELKTGRGNDVVRYVLDSNVTNDVKILVDMGNDNDRFTGTMRGDITNGHKMMASINGGTGSDLMTMYGTPIVPVRANDFLTDGNAINANGMGIGTGATFDLRMYGAGGNDRVFFDYQGEQRGTLKLELQGNDNQDTVSAIVRLMAGSTSGVGTNASPAYVRGDRDNDDVTFRISGANVRSYAHLDGGWDIWGADNDVGHRTRNVTPHFFNLGEDHIV